jgi:GR25 family glycosyltransferase involved in LPS biosynthesis
MAKVPVAKLWKRLLLAALVVCLVYLLWSSWRSYTSGPYILDIWVINLEKEQERWTNIQQKAAMNPAIQQKLHRWPATYGKDLTRDQAQQAGAGYVITMKRDFNEDKKTDKITSANVGAVGCWMSHKKLLTYLAEQPLPDSTGHLICEDDVEFPADFLQPSNRWAQVAPQIPADWDMVFLGIKKPIIGTEVSPDVKKMRTTYNKGNWGAHAYMVRHGALKTKILPSIEFMTNEIDVHYDMMADRWNIYICDPPVLQYNGELAAKSSINS